MLARPDWLEADKRDLHGQYEPHNVESAVSCEQTWNKGETWKDKIFKKSNHSNKQQ